MTKEAIEFLDRISETWDHDEVRSTPARIGSILAKTGIEPGMRVLDLGTGTGVLLPYLSELVGENGCVVAVDISIGMLSQAISKFSSLPNLKFEKKDFEKEPVEGRFDLIYLYCVYPHLHNPEKTLRRLVHNNLTEGGRIIIAFPSDENFINNIHREKKAESDLLPSAPILAERISGWRLKARVEGYSSEEFIISVEAAT